METTPVHTLNLARVQTESKRIIESSYTHFITLSLFFLPVSVSLITGPSFRISPYNFTVDHLHKLDQKRIIYHLLYVLIGYVFALCAIASITCSTHHGFLGKPITFLTALKSLTFSFFPILGTAIVALLISLSFLLFAASILMLVQNLGFAVDYNPLFFMLLIVVIIYFHVNWSLAFVVVVVDSKCGIAALMRSSYLIKGVRSVSLILVLYYGFCCGLFVWVLTDSLHVFSSWVYVLFTTMLGSSYLVWFLLQFTAANTVLYNYCKELHGELAIGSTEGFAHKYVNLPADDEKIPSVMTVVTP